MEFSICIISIYLNNVVHFLVGSKCHSLNSETWCLSLQPINLWDELCLTERPCLVRDIIVISQDDVLNLCLCFRRGKTNRQCGELFGEHATIFLLLYCKNTRKCHYWSLIGGKFQRLTNAHEIRSFKLESAKFLCLRVHSDQTGCCSDQRRFARQCCHIRRVPLFGR